jgi:hypothetical protein
MPPVRLPDTLIAARQQLADLTSRRDAALKQAADSLADINAQRAAIAARQAAGDTNGAATATSQLAAANDRRRQLLASAADFGRRIVGVVGQVAAGDLQAESDVPIALLPVRIETRSTAGRAQLRVRIYPDDIHVDQHDRGLSDEERAAGLDYWNAVWPADNADAWTALVARAGARRAPWVATALTPANLASRPSAAPQFPPTDPRGQRPPLVRTLPDRFHVFADQNGIISEAFGAPIPDELVVAMPTTEDFTPIPLDGDLPAIDQGMRWMVDYDAAVSVGMAVTLTLQRAGQRIDRLIVIGVRSTLAPDAASAQLGQLLVAHRFSDGAAFVPQGTPTNNTESDRTGWMRSDAVPPLALTPLAVDSGSNAGVLAAALGVPSSAVGDWPHAADIEQQRARAMNLALWAPTWEAMFERILATDPERRLLTDAEIDDVRTHFIEHVRARGPVPAVRLGKQPYGVLPIVATDAATFHPQDDGTIERRVVPFLRAMRAIWDEGTRSVPAVGSGDIDQTLPEILGTSPVMRGLRVRSVVTRNASYEKPILVISDEDNDAAQTAVAEIAWRLVQVDPSAVNDNGLLGKTTRALALPLAHESDAAFIAALLANPDTAPAPQSVLQALLGLAAKTELAHRDRLAAPADIDRLRAVAIDQAGNDVDATALRNAFAEVAQGTDAPKFVDQAAALIKTRVGLFDTAQLAARQPLPGLGRASASAFSQLTANGQQLAALQPGRAGLQLAGSLFAAARRQADFRAALRLLQAVPSVDERALLLGETLDLASHRLDAWTTAVATSRLARMRQQSKGVVIGAYGWVESIELTDPQPAQVPGLDGVVFASPNDGGYIHAPSLTHAATAAVLRSGRLSHHQGDANDSALNIDLSSTRVRTALSIIDGIRQGQPLGALLGYRLERALHDRSGHGLELDRFIYVLRALAPLVAGKLTDPGAAQESAAASNVVDGVALRERPWADVQAALVAGPADRTYIAAWTPPIAAESAAVQQAIADMDGIYDAVADVMLAEGVHQLVSGNATRAAAALDAIGGGESVPPVPQVVQTPRSGTSLTHRIAVVITNPPADRHGWNRNAPRALAEPRLESWAEAQFGDATSIALTAAGAVALHTLGELNLCALDLLFEADGDDVASTSLGWRIRRVLPDLGADLASVLLPFASTWELARSLRRLLANARPAMPARREDSAGVIWSVPAMLGRELAGTFEPGGDPTFRDRARAAQAALAAAAQPVDPSNDAAVRAALDALVPFGFRVPPQADALTLDQIAPLASHLIDEAQRRAVAADTAIAQAGDDHPEQLAAAFETIFGDGFLALPLIAAPPVDDGLTAALGAGGVKAQDGGRIRPWLARAAAVRIGTARYAETLLYREALRGRIQLRVAQARVPAVSKISTWIGAPFAAGEVLPRDPMTGIVVETIAGSPFTGREPLAAFIVDEWSDVVPRRIVGGDPANQNADRPIKTIATTGVAVNANGPNARPPQAVLLAISADGAAWTKDSLLHVVRDTMDLARLRTVTLERVPWAGCILPAIYCRDWSLQGEPALNFKALATEYMQAAALKYVKD